MLVISFGTKELAHCCTKLELAQERLGPVDAQALVALIADGEAHGSAAELIEFRDGTLHPSEDSISISFSPNYRAIFLPAGEKIPRTPEGRPNWEGVRRLLLIEIARL